MYSGAALSALDMPTQFTDVSSEIFAELGDSLLLDDPKGLLQVEGKRRSMYLFLMSAFLYSPTMTRVLNSGDRERTKTHETNYATRPGLLAVIRSFAIARSMSR